MGDVEKDHGRRLWRRGRQADRRQGPDGSLAPFGAVYLALLGLGTVGALVVYLLLVAFVPGASGTRLDAMKTALLVVAGSGAGAGLYVQYRKQQTDEAKSALDHANSRRDQDKLFTERYTTAAAQLGNPAAAVRLAGVYALARIADDSERDRPTCLKVLCAYLRMPYNPDGLNTEPAERQVRITAQTVIAERLHPDHPGFWLDARIDLADAHLIDLDFRSVTVGEFKADGATFSGDAGFREATFSGDAGFNGATFSGSAGFGEATFERDAGFGKVTFNGDAHFGGATFKKDAVFGGATFSGSAGFGGATFSGDAVFGEATFSEFSGFSEATFSGDAVFGEATFSRFIGFVKATFSGDARFDGATFNGVAEFRGATLNGDAGFREATFSGDAGFDGATFSGFAGFGEATFSGDAGFDGATFNGFAGFDGTRFRRDHAPEWPAGWAEPSGIVWVDPPAADPGPDPGPPVGTADPPTGP